MMTLTELQGAKINPAIAREAYIQTSHRLEDILDTKKTFEQKAFTLFSGYLTVCLALLGVAGSIYKDHGPTVPVIAFLISGSLLVVGAILFVAALKDDNYGMLASSPEMWLENGVIDGPDSVLPLMLAYITHHHRNRMDVSIAHNNKKARLISLGIYVGIIAPFALATLLLTPLGAALQASLQ